MRQVPALSAQKLEQGGYLAGSRLSGCGWPLRGCWGASSPSWSPGGLHSSLGSTVFCLGCLTHWAPFLLGSWLRWDPVPGACSLLCLTGSPSCSGPASNATSSGGPSLAPPTTPLFSKEGAPYPASNTQQKGSWCDLVSLCPAQL